MRILRRAAVAVLLAWVLCSGATSRADEAPASPSDWREQARLEGLTAAEIETLGEAKVLMGVRSFNQIFSAYAHRPVPVFVTSDSVLRAYNVLLQESLGRMERARAARLARILRLIWAGLPRAMPEDAEFDADRWARSARAARVTIGTALVLLGEETPDAPPAVAALIQEEVALVTAAAGVRRPGWLSPNEATLGALDYDRFRPRSFYVSDEVLEPYFRASAWLQDVPFRLSNDDDLLAVALLLNAFGRTEEGEPRLASYVCRSFVRQLTRFLGTSGEASIYTLRARRSDPRTECDLSEVASQYARLHPDLSDEERREADLVVHVLPRIDTPDSLLLKRVFEARRAALAPDALPSGLDVAAALGSPHALASRQSLPPSHAEVLENWPELDHGTKSDLFRRYLHVLARLVDPAEPDAPSFLRSRAWAAKSTNTVLAGWAQIRHAWALCAMSSRSVFGEGGAERAGWVEPDPAFFAALADLIIATEAALEDAGAFDAGVGLETSLSDLRWFVRTISGLDEDGGLSAGYDALWDALPPSQRARLDRIWERLFFDGYQRWRDLGSETQDPEPTREQRQAEILRQMAVSARASIESVEGEMASSLEWRDAYLDPGRLRARWQALQVLAHRIEGLANKQLRGLAFVEDDNAFLRGYAKALAFPMLYDGNMLTFPPADAPPVAAVFSAYSPASPSAASERPSILHAAVGMPCALYVLWPDAGEEVLCRGGVMPYREFVADTCLTDDAWRERLSAPDAPPTPDWLAPYTAPLRKKAVEDK